MNAGWPPDSKLWSKGFAEDDKDRARLARSLISTRENADGIASSIEDSLPEFTVHDGTHLDALWPLVDLLAPTDLELTPPELWVLGAAIVLHDLGLALSAYPGGRDELRTDPRWPDVLAAAVTFELGHNPSRNEIEAASADALGEADRTILRLRHAARAAELVGVKIPSGDPLVADPELRATLGTLAGRVAESHWWSPHELVSLGPTQGAPPGFPRGWTVRPVLLAILLRCADAAHLDRLRAPERARQRRRLSPFSAQHWDFQSRLGGPALEADFARFRFHSLQDFGPDMSAAWWLGVEHLRLLDRELQAADELLVGARYPSLTARSVADVHDVRVLAKTIRVVGWEPVDAQVKVGDVAALVSRLGGRSLYGRATGVPLRELIQNASDAVRARAALEPGFNGRIVVRADAALETISVEDNGIGMNRDVLTGVLLDFGKSLWSSSDVAAINPGLRAAGFQPTGRFGIGFFASFMWTQDVSVVSRHRAAARSDTLRLKFVNGLSTRPVLSTAGATDERNEPGSVVRLSSCVVEQEFREGAFLYDEDQGEFLPVVTTESLGRLVASLAPALPVDLYVAVDDSEPVRVVAANDWLELPDDELRFRIGDWGGSNSHLTPIGDSQTSRAALPQYPPGFYSTGLGEPPGVLVAGGLVVGRSPEFVGVVVAADVNAARTSGSVTFPPEAVSAWASDQARMIGSRGTFAQTVQVLRLGGDTAELPLVESAQAYLSFRGLVDWARERDSFICVELEAQLEVANDDIPLLSNRDADLPDDALDIQAVSRSTREHSLLMGRTPIDPFDRILDAAAAAWQVDRSTIDETWDYIEVDVPEVYGVPIGGRRLRRPADRRAPPTKTG